MVDPENPDKMYLLRKQNYKVFVNGRPISSVLCKLPVIPDTGAKSNFLREDWLTLFMKKEVLEEPKTTTIMTLTTNGYVLSVVSCFMIMLVEGRNL